MSKINTLEPPYIELSIIEMETGIPKIVRLVERLKKIDTLFMTDPELSEIRKLEEELHIFLLETFGGNSYQFKRYQYISQLRYFFGKPMNN